MDSQTLVFREYLKLRTEKVPREMRGWRDYFQINFRVTIYKMGITMMPALYGCFEINQDSTCQVLQYEAEVVT